MKQDQENFDPLLRLLALKRHEQPPPGYFNALPGQIRARLQAPPAEPFFAGLVRLFSERVKPALAYAFVLAVCAVMACAVNSFLHLESHPDLASQTSVSPVSSVQNLEAGESDRLSASLIGGFAQSSNLPSLFQIEPAAFHPDHR